MTTLIRSLAFAGSLSLAAGCAQNKPDSPDAVLPEVGWHVDQITQRQVNQAAGDRTVIYHYEFQADAPKLTDYGERHVREVADDVVKGKARLTIEPSGDASIDHDRRHALVDRLASLGMHDADDAVVVDAPLARGTPGEEAANVDADTPRGGQTNGSSGNNNNLGGGLSGGSSLSSGGLGGGTR